MMFIAVMPIGEREGEVSEWLRQTPTCILPPPSSLYE
jgi:hypothetical protein